MRIRRLLDLTEPRIELLTGEAELDRTVLRVVTTDLPDPSRYVTQGDLVLTGMVWRRGPGDAEIFVRALADADVAALVAGDEGAGIPADLLAACRDRGLPLLRVPAALSFATVTEQVVRRLPAARTGAVSDFLGQHRHLVSATLDADGDGLAAVLNLIHHYLSMRCWVLSPTGRVVAGTGPALSDKIRDKALRHYLSGQRLPHALDTGADTAVSVFAVADPAQPRLVSWLLVFDSDVRTWDAERHRLAGELAALVTAESRRLDHGRSVRHPVADELVRRVAADADTAELAQQLRLAGLPTDATMVVVAAALDGDTGDRARAVLEELLSPDVPGTAVAVLEDLAVALVPADAALVRAGVDRASTLTPALARTPLRIGVSGPAAGAGGLRGALDEARHACRLAGMSQEKVAIVGQEQLSSHLMLLAAVPDDVRRAFRNRVLGPLQEYDRLHRADLVLTLRAFLANSGSWTKCAEVLHVHVNTLRYRIQRIEQMTGRDLGKLDERVDFFLALALTGNP